MHSGSVTNNSTSDAPPSIHVYCVLKEVELSQEVTQEEPLPYYYDYNVHDGYKGTNFGQHEKSDGKNVYGSYTVDLPDGRKQRVDYTADHYRGYVAKVSYYGKAQHPKHYGPAVTFFNKGYGHGGGYH
nr:cuticle protein 18.6-like [Procambarus clarkii]